MKLIEGNVDNRVINLYEPEMVSLRALVQQAAAAVGRRPRILPVPSGWMIAGLGLADRLGLRLPVSVDNLEGFLGNQTALHRPAGLM